jgi:hypothetical protein
MAVIYSCDRILWRVNEHCSAAVAAIVVLDNHGVRRLLPPPYWRLMDVDGVETPVVLCPRCGAQYEQSKPPPAPARPRLGVIEGGKGDPDDGGKAA